MSSVESPTKSWIRLALQHLPFHFQACTGHTFAAQALAVRGFGRGCLREDIGI